MKKVIFIHGWESGPSEHWYQDEKTVLETRGYEVYIPEMPGGSFVKEGEWVETLVKLEPDSETILIGHSLGAPTILRYLELADVKVDKVFLIAGFASSLHLDYPNAEYPDAFVNHSFDWEKIRQGAGEFIVLNQDHDPWVPFEKGEELAENLHGKLVKVAGDNHFDKMDLDLINREIQCR